MNLRLYRRLFFFVFFIGIATYMIITSLEEYKRVDPSLPPFEEPLDEVPKLVRFRLYGNEEGGAGGESDELEGLKGRRYWYTWDEIDEFYGGELPEGNADVNYAAGPEDEDPSDNHFIKGIQHDEGNEEIEPGHRGSPFFGGSKSKLFRPN